MNVLDKVYWPFVITDEYKNIEFSDKIAFLKTVTSLGFKGFRFGGNNYGADAETLSEKTGAGGLIIERSFTRERWELRLNTDHRGGMSAYLSSFQVAADALVDWLQGESLENVTSKIESYLVVMSSKTNTSHTLYPAKKERLEDESK